MDLELETADVLRVSGWLPGLDLPLQWETTMRYHGNSVIIRVDSHPLWLQFQFTLSACFIHTPLALPVFGRFDGGRTGKPRAMLTRHGNRLIARITDEEESACCVIVYIDVPDLLAAILKAQAALEGEAR